MKRPCSASGRVGAGSCDPPGSQCRAGISAPYCSSHSHCSSFYSPACPCHLALSSRDSTPFGTYCTREHAHRTSRPRKTTAERKGTRTDRALEWSYLDHSADVGQVRIVGRRWDACASHSCEFCLSSQPASWGASTASVLCAFGGRLVDTRTVAPRQVQDVGDSGIRRMLSSGFFFFESIY